MLMGVPWGWGETILSLWFICYIITFIIFLWNDSDIDKVIGYSFYAVFSGRSFG